MLRIAVLFAAGAALVITAGSIEANAAARLPTGIPAAATLLLRYDFNHDGVITRAEMDAGLKAEFDAADVNKDGCLGSDEVAAENERRLHSDGAEASPLRDWNLDGCVDIHEFSNTAHSYFELADRKKDGQVTMLELRGPSMPLAARTAPPRGRGAPPSAPPPGSTVGPGGQYPSGMGGIGGPGGPGGPRY
jgi:hypothetical protein